jgi:putative tryptophan/tyrosine transport system substrate-binding protein
MMNRRTFLRGLTLGTLATPLAAEAQQPGKVWRIGFLGAPAPLPANVNAFRQGLRENGYVEGRNLLIEWRSAEGQEERLPGLAAELLRLNVEVIVTEGPSAALAAKNATTVTPIVFTFVPDPVGLGIVASLARPGRNITGLANLGVELTAKRVQLLKEAIPSLESIVILTDPANPGSAPHLKEAQIAARRLGLEASLVEVRHRNELEHALAKIAHKRNLAVVLAPGPFMFTHRMQIVELATSSRLPVLGWVRSVAESGALITYGANNLDILRQAGIFVDKILKGAKPGDLPVEQPTKFELVINLKTAKALGLTIPQSVLGRADQVIQ